MRYALLLHYPQPAVSTVRQEEIDAGKAAFHAYAKALEDAGVLRSARTAMRDASSGGSAVTVLSGAGSVP